MAGKVQIIVGGQYGSEGKGAICGYLASLENDLFAVRTGGPNAGHTVWAGDEQYKLRSIPAAAVTNQAALLGIAQGSEIDPAVLQAEGGMLERQLVGRVWNRLLIDAQATVILPSNLTREADIGLVERIGSTGKGIGAARSDRIMRIAPTWEEYSGDLGQIGSFPWNASDVALEAHQTLDRGGTVQIEAAQGFGLGLHAGYYPFCTSGDCRAIDALAAVGISPWDPTVREVEVWVVFRIYPIRVAGNSGPLRNEMSWAGLGLPEEHTTVTGKVRRIGGWDQDLAEAAMMGNGRDVHVALTMFDQVEKRTRGVTRYDQLDDDAKDTLESYNKRLYGRIELVGTSPRTLIDLRGIR